MQIGSLEAFTNREDWIQPFELTDDDGPVVASAITITVRDKNGCSVLSGSLADSKIVEVGSGLGTFQWTFGVDAVHDLCAGQYKVGIVVTQSGIVKEPFVGTVEVLDGVVD